MVAHTYYPRTRGGGRVEAVGPGAEGHPQLHPEFQACSISPYLKTNQLTRGKEENSAGGRLDCVSKQKDTFFHRAGV